MLLKALLVLDIAQYFSLSELLALTGALLKDRRKLCDQAM